MIKSTITDEQFRLLRERFENEILHGKQDYHKLKPKNWDNLMKYIEKNGPFDVIVDGMNVVLGSLCDDWREQGKFLRRTNLNEVNSIQSLYG